MAEDQGKQNVRSLHNSLCTYPGEDGVLVLDAMCLINDDVAPMEAAEVVLLLDHHLVTGDAHMEAVGLQQVVLLVLLWK